jgi:hypothetical protein
MILDRWMALEKGNGIEYGRAICRRLNIAACVLAAGVIALGAYWGYRTFIPVLPSIAIGWLVAERNALSSRIDQWPTVRRYLDWERIERDQKSGVS